MDVIINNEQEGMKVRMSGQFTFADNQKFREVLDITQQLEVKFIEIDFAQVDFIDSAGLGMLLLLRDACQHRHVPISLHSPQGQVEKIFNVSKFDQLFSIS